MDVRQACFDVPGGGRLAYDDTGGTGRPVLCVPGLGDVRALYRFLTPHLVDAGYRVITVDLRGHGESSVDWPEYTVTGIGRDILAVLRYLDTGPAIVIAESLAAAAAVWAAAEEPELVAALVLCGPVVRDQPMNPFVRLAVRAVGHSPALWGRFYESLYPSKPADLRSYRKALVANLGEPGRMAALRGLIQASKAECAARLAEVRAPALVVMGTADADFPDASAEARWLAGELGGDSLLVPGAGHYPQAERPDEVCPRIVTFLHSVSGR